jgi:hypothetical protein
MKEGAGFLPGVLFIYPFQLAVAEFYCAFHYPRHQIQNLKQQNKKLTKFNSEYLGFSKSFFVSLNHTL